jgi:hypothetical protein
VGDYLTTIDEDNSITISYTQLLSNSTDPDGDTLSVVATSHPLNGTLVDNGDDTVTFTPNTNFNGNASFIFTVDDHDGSQVNGTCRITVNPVNDACVALNFNLGSFVKNFDIRITNGDLLANVLDVDSNPTITDFSNNSNGTLVDNGDGSYTFTPDTDYVGDTTFSYTATDGEYSSTATMTLATRERHPLTEKYVTAPEGVSCWQDFSGSSGDGGYATFDRNDDADGGEFNIYLDRDADYTTRMACIKFLGDGLPAGRRYIEFDFTPYYNDETVNPSFLLRILYYSIPMDAKLYKNGQFVGDCNNVISLDADTGAKYCVSYLDDYPIYFSIEMEAVLMENTHMQCIIDNAVGFY